MDFIGIITYCDHVLPKFTNDNVRMIKNEYMNIFRYIKH